MTAGKTSLTDNPVWGPGSQGSKLCTKSNFFCGHTMWHAVIFVLCQPSIEPCHCSGNEVLTTDHQGSPTKSILKERKAKSPMAAGTAPQWSQLLPLDGLVTIPAQSPAVFSRLSSNLSTTGLSLKAALPKGKTICHPHSFLAQLIKEDIQRHLLQLSLIPFPAYFSICFVEWCQS